MPKNILPYAIMRDDKKNSVEVELYGEVVENVPIDWWTGEKVSGLFIELSQFLTDLDTLKEADDITFRINSTGGDVEAGITIYNRIRELSGHTTTIVDGIAASAASIIAQAGDERKVNVGTQTMIHGASAGLIGYYNVNDLQKVENMLNSINKAVAGIYSERTGQDVGAIARMMKKESWMTPEEAVENGFADEIIGQQAPVVDKVEGKKDLIIVNGVEHILRGIPMPNMNIRQTLTEALRESDDDVKIFERAKDQAKTMIVNGREPSAIDTISKGERETMTIEELRESYPELVKQITDEATTAACASVDESVKAALDAERARIQEIDSIAKMVGDQALVEKAKYEEPMNASELALKAMQAQQAAGKEFLQNRNEELKETANAISNPNQGMEDQVAKDATELQALVAKIKEEG
ncbi:MAG: ATP-dependent Clp protease proteolytic subunit [Lachnospiraceae bacterium]|nr:ATP-dependent Clp protease proteolytic subunit [Lachnospiraceae bacterium]